MTTRQLPEVRHITVGYGAQAYGDIWIDEQDDIHFSGKKDALAQLWQSITRQAFFKGLTPSQTLARMTAKLRGPLWAVEAKQYVARQQPTQRDDEKPARPPITDEYVAELEQAAKAWDDPAVRRMVREMDRRRKKIQQKGEQESESGEQR